jgi:hypothetical protein
MTKLNPNPLTFVLLCGRLLGFSFLHEFDKDPLLLAEFKSDAEYVEDVPKV